MFLRISSVFALVLFLSGFLVGPGLSEALRKAALFQERAMTFHLVFPDLIRDPWTFEDGLNVYGSRLGGREDRAERQQQRLPELDAASIQGLLYLDRAWVPARGPGRQADEPGQGLRKAALFRERAMTFHLVFPDLIRDPWTFEYGLNVYGSRLGGREDTAERHQQRLPELDAASIQGLLYLDRAWVPARGTGGQADEPGQGMLYLDRAWVPARGTGGQVQDAHKGSLSDLKSTYLKNCYLLQQQSGRIRYGLTQIYFDDMASIRAYSDSLKSIQQYLDDELAQCSGYRDVSAALSTSLQFFEIAVQSDSINHNGRTLFFYFDQVPDLYRETILTQILPQIDAVEAVFDDELRAPLNKESLAFYITNRRIMKEDIGGANLGSFIWLPVEYSLGYGQQWPDGVREGTVRHEIVHAFMNHATRNPNAFRYPKVFVEGMALYLSGNRLIEFHRKTQVRLSDEYIDFLETFSFMEEQAGQNAVFRLIRDMLSGERTDFFYEFEAMTGTSYEAYVNSKLSFSERISEFIQTTLRIPRSWQQSFIVFSTIFLITVLFITVQLPEKNKEEIRRNVSVGFLFFIIAALLSQGWLVDMAYQNYIAFLLISLFTAILLRGYPQVMHEDLMKDLQERSAFYQEDEEEE